MSEAVGCSDGGRNIYGKAVFLMEQNLEYRQQLAQEYRRTVEPLLKYLPWLTKNAGQPGGRTYQGESDSEGSLSFPVYDSTLMNFIKEVSVTPLMERNYQYIYTRNRIKTHDDERRVIASAEIKDWDLLRGILSKYVLGGRTKALLWSEAVRENIFAAVLDQMRKIVEYWDKPLDISPR